jgi:hypothetical protein
VSIGADLTILAAAVAAWALLKALENGRRLQDMERRAREVQKAMRPLLLPEHLVPLVLDLQRRLSAEVGRPVFLAVLEAAPKTAEGRQESR